MKDPKVAERMDQLLQLTQSFCRTYLNEDYERLCVKLINKMSRKRDVPFVSGKIEIWAAGIIHALGTVNFLFDNGTKPYASVQMICEFFKTVQSTTSQKSRWIQDTFKMSYFDTEFATRDNADSNPLANMGVINGLVVPLDMFRKK